MKRHGHQSPHIDASFYYIEKSAVSFKNPLIRGPRVNTSRAPRLAHASVLNRNKLEVLVNAWNVVQRALIQVEPEQLVHFRALVAYSAAVRA
jgi:hypothetical protein